MHEEVVEADVAELTYPEDSVTFVASHILSSDDALGDPYSMSVVRGNLLITEFRAEPFVHVLDRQTGTLLYSFGRRGQGPGEFMRAPKLVSSSRTDLSSEAWIFESGSMRLTGFAANVRPIKLSPLTSRFVRPEIRGIHQIVRTDRGAFVATVFESRETGTPTGLSWAEIDGEGHTVGKSHPFTIDKVRISSQALAEAYQHVMCISPSGKQVAVAYRLAGRLDIVEQASKVFRGARVPLPFTPAIGHNPESGRVEFWSGNDQVRAGYIDCTSGLTHIYASFSGRRVREFPGRLPADCQFVHVFSWDAELVRVLRLDHRARAIAVDLEENYIYTIDVSGQDGPVIRVSKLPR